MSVNSRFPQRMQSILHLRSAESIPTYRPRKQRPIKMTNETKQSNIVRFLGEYSVPLIVGVIAAMFMANTFPSFYEHLVSAPIYGLFSSAADHAHGHHDAHGSSWDHYFSLHFLVNDLFMVLFFGVAAKEITEACLPEGALNPPSKAINPLCGTVGGVLGPVGVFFGLNAIMGSELWANGWGIPTATDIALAWLVAKLIFGKGHPAISFLLLLAVADDAIGLGIIAFAYPDPAHPTEWLNALWIVPGMLAAFSLRHFKVTSWIPYVAIGGAFCWWGLFSAHLHPALALVFVVPFIPGPNVDLGLYAEEKSTGKAHAHHSPLESFEHSTRTFVDFGLFFFAFANAGVSMQGVTGLTWIVLASLIAGKTLGITLCSYLADRAGFHLPSGMNLRHLVATSVIAGLGLTVALFVSGQAFSEAGVQGAAKMGALLSVLAAPTAFVVAVALGVANVQLPAIQFPLPFKPSQSNAGA